MNAGQWIDTLQQQMAATSVWEWIAVTAGVAEVLWARANKVWLYPAGIISICITIVLFINAKLYAESFLNVYYLVMSIYGWAHWARRKNEPPLPVMPATKKEWGIAWAIMIGGFVLLFLVLRYQTDSNVPAADAFVSATAWAGMWLLARRKIENWLLLNLSNLVAIPLLYSKGLLLYSLLTIILFIVAIFGYIEWRKVIQTTTRGFFVAIMLLLFTTQVDAQGNDIRWLRSIHSNAAKPQVMEAVSLSSYALGFAVPAGQLIYGYAANDSAFKRNGWQTVGALALTTVVTYGLKYSIQRSRPYDTYPDIVPHQYEDSYSMPSGHTSVAFSLATSMSLQYRKWYYVAPAFVYAGVVGYSRMHLGVHYPSDVLVGAAVGAGSAWLSYKGQQWLLKSKKKKANN